ncbi:MAG: single-stranded DNA-binding protein [Mycoplasmataceae bacterium]|nr:single-stranded DNA-binding protein [Mycoplasmataceae bacterium]
MNKVFLVGRLATDPIIKTTSKGNNLVNISIAVNDSYNKNNSYFFQCSAWDRNATFIEQYLKKGDLVAIDGRLTRREYVTREGKQQFATDIVIESINSLAKAKPTANPEFNKIFNETANDLSKNTNDSSIDDLTNLLNNEKGNA